MRCKDIFVYFNFCTVNMSLEEVRQAALSYSEVVQKDISQAISLEQLDKPENSTETTICAGEQSTD